MSKPLFTLLGILFVAALGGIVFLGVYRLPAPSQQMETQIPNDRLALQ